jgi:hypothetical protein
MKRGGWQRTAFGRTPGHFGEQLGFEDVVLDRAATRVATDAAVEQSAMRVGDVFRDCVWLALDRICVLLGPGGRFIIDAVWDTIGTIPRNRAESSRIGPIMREYAATGRIVPTGDHRPSARPRTHGKPQREWRVMW